MQKLQDPPHGWGQGDPKPEPDQAPNFETLPELGSSELRASFESKWFTNQNTEPSLFSDGFWELQIGALGDSSGPHHPTGGVGSAWLGASGFLVPLSAWPRGPHESLETF